MGFLRWEQHAKTDKSHNQATCDPQAGDGDAEGVHHHLAGIVSHHHNSEDIDRRHFRLLVALGTVHVPGKPQKQRHGG